MINFFIITKFSLIKYRIYPITIQTLLLLIARVNNTRNAEYLKLFGQHLRKVRKSKNISMEKLALEAGIEYSQIFDIEHGNINTTISTVHAISKALGLPEKELFDFDNSGISRQ